MTNFLSSTSPLWPLDDSKASDLRYITHVVRLFAKPDYIPSYQQVHLSTVWHAARVCIFHHPNFKKKI